MDQKTICFFGHRELRTKKDIKSRIIQRVSPFIEQGYGNFLMGSHGEFDLLSLNACRDMRKDYKDIEITVILTSLAKLKKDEFGYSGVDYYNDVKTSIYEIEEEHFKRQITISNQKMVDDSDLVICYIDPNKEQSGAKRAVNYAKKKGKTVINLYEETDDPNYGKTKEQIQKELDDFFREIRANKKQ